MPIVNLPSPPRTMRLKPSGEVDWSSVLEEQRSTQPRNQPLTSGLDYLRRTATPRRNRPATGVDPLSAGPVVYVPPPPAISANRPQTAGATPSTRAERGAAASAALQVSELDFHLTRVLELLRRSDRAPLPEQVALKVRQIAAFDSLMRSMPVD